MNRNPKEKFDIFLQSLAVVSILSAINRLVYHDSMPIAIGTAVGMVVFFWLGRLSMRLIMRRRKHLSGIADE
ncbi:MAG: hypothetical protein QME62_12875 [Armatimonadota bacterium]|nr:hypothetical protein [Armatimonadota bacterium]